MSTWTFITRTERKNLCVCSVQTVTRGMGDSVEVCCTFNSTCSHSKNSGKNIQNYILWNMGKICSSLSMRAAILNVLL